MKLFVAPTDFAWYSFLAAQKPDEVIRWCDTLEARLTAAQTTAATLLDATLHQILTA